MDNSLEEKRAQRYLFLKRLYDLANGDTVPHFSRGEIGSQLGWDKATTDKVSIYLKEEGLVKFVALGTVSLTHAGVIQIENALNHPGQQTQYFPAVSIIIVSAQGDVTVNGNVIGRDQNTSNLP